MDYFQQMCLRDATMQALYRGDVAWGDVPDEPLVLDVRPPVQRAVIQPGQLQGASVRPLQGAWRSPLVLSQRTSSVSPTRTLPRTE